MKLHSKNSISIRNRLLIQFGLATVLISVILFFVIKIIITQAITSTQDKLLSAALNSISEKFYIDKDELSLDLPYDTFSLIGSISDDKIFYRIELNGNFLTGYQDFPVSSKFGNLREPFFHNKNYNNQVIRVASIKQSFFLNGIDNDINISIGQTLNLQSNILFQVTNNLYLLIFIYLILSFLIAFLAANLTLSPIRFLASKLTKKEPNNLDYINEDAPVELKPLINSLNGFIKKIKILLNQTEIFISEAAHHIKTPLAVVKSESELALLKSKNPENRNHMRNVIEAINDTNRSTSQLLDQAMVLYKLEKPENNKFYIISLLNKIIKSLKTNADLRDIKIQHKNLSKDKLINIDPILYETAIRNVIDNAIKYSSSESEISIISEMKENHYIISIRNKSNQKLNISKENLLKRFKRGKNSKNIIGTGLGLSIAGDIMQGLKGNLKIKFERGEIFCVSLLFSL